MNNDKPLNVKSVPLQFNEEASQRGGGGGWQFFCFKAPDGREVSMELSTVSTAYNLLSQMNSSDDIVQQNLQQFSTALQYA